MTCKMGNSAIFIEINLFVSYDIKIKVYMKWFFCLNHALLAIKLLIRLLIYLSSDN